MHISRRYQKILLALIVALILSFAKVDYQKQGPITSVASQNQPGLYPVTEVVDGDTIVVNMQGNRETVRLIGIDTPELHHPKKPVQCFAQAAKDFTSSLIAHKSVRLEADPEDDNRDLYGRLLRYVYLPDGKFVNEAIVEQGYGFAYTHFPFTKLVQMRAFEKSARSQHRGLWAGCQVNHDARGNWETNPA